MSDVKTTGANNLDKFLGEMLSMLQDAKTFAASEIPKFIQEVLSYHLARACVIAVGVVGVALIVQWFGRAIRENYRANFKSWREYKVDSDAWHKSHPGEKWGPDRPDDGADEIGFCFQIVGGIISLLAIVSSVLTILKITLAPRVFLVEYFADAIRGM